MAVVEKRVTIGDHELILQTGKIAKQAAGAVWVQAGDSVVLVTAQGSASPREGIDFLPLTVDYQEKKYAAGKIPGGFFKREGRLGEHETLTSRLIDRSIRPLFAEGWGCETQIIATVMSADPKHPTDALAMTGASAALTISDLPFEGPIAGIRVGRVKGEFVANPSFEELEDADINIFVTCSADAIMMVEGGGLEMTEADAIDALLFAHEQSQAVIKAQLELQKEVGLKKRVATPTVHDKALVKQVEKLAMPGIKKAYSIKEKLPRYAALDAAKADVKAKMLEDDKWAEHVGSVGAIMGDLKYNYVRGFMLKDKTRIDGRNFADIRNIDVEVGILPRVHGSALFTRGETQSIVAVTLGTRMDEQRIDGLMGESFSRFMLHYNFPPYSVGEARFMRGPGRREIGHGVLARRALENVVQIDDDFPYTVRIVSEITESNGSSSMATVCGGSLAMMDAGVPMGAPTAGIAMGLIKEGDDMAILSDILGDEDHLGDMDFKVTGTEKGITAIQMDIKIKGIDRAVLSDALEQARVGRLHILKCMAEGLSTTREEMSEHAPRITSFKIKQDRIRDVIGPGGKVIKDIIARTGCQVNVEDDGTVNVASTDGEAGRRAVKMIKDLTQEAEVGKLYLGTVRKILDFGAVVEIFPGSDGLVHISELADKRVNSVEDVLQEGDEVMVKCLSVERGKVRLSRKAAIADEKQKAAEG